MGYCLTSVAGSGTKYNVPQLNSGWGRWPHLPNTILPLRNSTSADVGEGRSLNQAVSEARPDCKIFRHRNRSFVSLPSALGCKVPLFHY